MVLRDIERLNRRASFGAILAKSRALSNLSCFFTRIDLSASSSCRRRLIERASYVPLRHLWESVAGPLEYRKKGKRDLKNRRRPINRDIIVAVQRLLCGEFPSFPLSLSLSRFREIFYSRVEYIRNVAWIFPWEIAHAIFMRACNVPSVFFSLFQDVSFSWWFRVTYRTWLLDYRINFGQCHIFPAKVALNFISRSI